MPADQKRDEEELGALWEKVSANGTQMLTGNVGGVDVVCFLAKRVSDKSPTWRVLKSRPRENTTGMPNDQRTSVGRVSNPRLPIGRDEQTSRQRAVEDDDDIPF